MGDNDMRLNTDLRKKKIIIAAMHILAWGKPFTRETVAERCKISAALITHHFGDMDTLRHEAIKRGCEKRINSIIVLGLYEKHPDALALPKSVKRQAAVGE